MSKSVHPAVRLSAAMSLLNSRSHTVRLPGISALPLMIPGVMRIA